MSTTGTRISSLVWRIRADGKRGRTAANMYWELGPDKALIVEFDAHEGLWMITNMGVYFTSMDFLYRPVSYTPAAHRWTMTAR